MPDGKHTMLSIIGPSELVSMFFVAKLLGTYGTLRNGKELSSALGSFRKELNEQDEAAKIEGYLNGRPAKNPFIYARIDSLSRQTL
jgi:hypothetical protein